MFSVLKATRMTLAAALVTAGLTGSASAGLIQNVSVQFGDDVGSFGVSNGNSLTAVTPSAVIESSNRIAPKVNWNDSNTLTLNFSASPAQLAIPGFHRCDTTQTITLDRQANGFRVTGHTSVTIDIDPVFYTDGTGYGLNLTTGINDLSVGWNNNTPDPRGTPVDLRTQFSSRISSPEAGRPTNGLLGLVHPENRVFAYMDNNSGWVTQGGSPIVSFGSGRDAVVGNPDGVITTGLSGPVLDPLDEVFTYQLGSNRRAGMNIDAGYDLSTSRTVHSDPTTYINLNGTWTLDWELIIGNYTPTPAPGSAALFGLGGLVAARRRR